jgi:hypothetical protein
MSRVYLLGAGFSRAVSGDMPMMKDLSAAVQAKVPDLPGASTPLAKDFEQWLSYLVDTPPWLSQGDQLRNLAAFNDVARAVHSALDERQAAAVANGPCPEWLKKLVLYWQSTAATVITFNYDLLVELAWYIEVQNRSIELTRLYPVPLTYIASRTGTVLGGSKSSPGLRLLKLHGSLSWRYSGAASPPGDIIYDMWIHGRQGWTVEGISSPYEDADLLSADREPMIVPPTAVKSSYYNNRTLRSLWMQAAESLSLADELVMMGFSLPVTDLLVASMLTTNLSVAATITPVDYAAAVVDRVKDVFAIDHTNAHRLVDSFAGLGDDAIPKWVDTFANISP